MTRKLLFLVFANDSCRRTHAFLHALDLHRLGHQVRIILDGPATQSLRERSGRFGELFDDALRAHLLVGVCKTAAGGCSTDDPAQDVTRLAQQAGVPLLDDLSGHAGIGEFVAAGYEIVTF